MNTWKVCSLNRDDLAKAIAWAWGTAKARGYVVTRRDGMIWVHDGTHELGCEDDYDFVVYMDEDNKARAALAR